MTNRLSYLDVDPRPQQVAHLLQDLFLQGVPGHRAVHVEHKRQPKPAQSHHSLSLQRRTRTVLHPRQHKTSRLDHLFPWWPLQARLHTSRIIFSGPRFLLGDEVRGVTAPCMKDGDLLLSGPYLKLLWFRFARRLPAKRTCARKIRMWRPSGVSCQKRRAPHLSLCAGFPA